MENIRAATMQQLLVVLVVVAVGILQTVPPVCSLGFGSAVSQLGEVRATTTTGSQQIQVTPQTAEYSSDEEALHQNLEMQVMQYHHQKSPYARPDLTQKDRALIAVTSSQERARKFDGRIHKGSRRSQSKAVFSSPTNSNEGSYLMQIEFGTPGKVLSAILDTGSDLVWIQCEPCTSCYAQQDPIFDPTTSSSYATYSCTGSMCSVPALPSTACDAGNACTYRYGYGDASTTQGTFSTETITLTSTGGGTQSYPGFAFGCGHLNQGLFQGTDGLVGLGQGPVSFAVQMGNQFGNVFSYCLVDFYAAPTQTSQLLFGSAGGGMVYTPVIPNSANPTFYYLGLKGILVDGVPLNIPAGTFDIDSTGEGGFIIDSGTTLTQLQVAAYTPLLAALESLLDYPRVDGSSIGLDLCYDLSQAANPTVPSVTFQFDGVDVDLPGNNLFLQVDTIGDFCLAMQGSEFGFGIYGNVQQQNFNVAFDRANARVGFAPKTC